MNFESTRSQYTALEAQYIDLHTKKSKLDEENTAAERRKSSLINEVDRLSKEKVKMEDVMKKEKADLDVQKENLEKARAEIDYLMNGLQERLRD